MISMVFRMNRKRPSSDSGNFGEMTRIKIEGKMSRYSNTVQRLKIAGKPGRREVLIGSVFFFPFSAFRAKDTLPKFCKTQKIKSLDSSQPYPSPLNTTLRYNSV